MPPKHTIGQPVTAQRETRGVRVNNRQWTNLKSDPPHWSRNWQTVHVDTASRERLRWLDTIPRVTLDGIDTAHQFETTRLDMAAATPPAAGGTTLSCLRAIWHGVCMSCSSGRSLCLEQSSTHFLRHPVQVNAHGMVEQALLWARASRQRQFPTLTWRESEASLGAVGLLLPFDNW